MKIIKSNNWIDYYISSNKFIRKYIKTIRHPLDDPEFVVSYDLYLNCTATFYTGEICWFLLTKDKRNRIHRDDGPIDINNSEYFCWYYKGQSLKTEEKYWNK